jgi:hypothetical protein
VHDEVHAVAADVQERVFGGGIRGGWMGGGEEEGKEGKVHRASREEVAPGYGD